MKFGTVILDAIRVILKFGGNLYLTYVNHGGHFSKWPLCHYKYDNDFGVYTHVFVPKELNGTKRTNVGCVITIDIVYIHKYNDKSQPFTIPVQDHIRTPKTIG